MLQEPHAPGTDTQNFVKHSSFNMLQKTNGTLKLFAQEHLVKGLLAELCSELRKLTRDGEAPEAVTTFQSDGQGEGMWSDGSCSPAAQDTGTVRNVVEGGGTRTPTSLSPHSLPCAHGLPAPPTFKPKQKPKEAVWRGQPLGAEQRKETWIRGECLAHIRNHSADNSHPVSAATDTGHPEPQGNRLLTQMTQSMQLFLESYLSATVPVHFTSK